MHQLMNKIKAKTGAAELFRLKSKTIPVNFEIGHLKSIDISDYEGRALRVINKGKIGFSSSAGNNEPNSLIEKAMATSEFGILANFDFPEKGSYPEKSLKIYGLDMLRKYLLLIHGLDIS